MRAGQTRKDDLEATGRVASRWVIMHSLELSVCRCALCASHSSSFSVGDRTLIDSARINLGMARGNMAMSKYMGIVNDNLPALLNWKTRRQQFKQT